jgi:hypothetical protein
MQPQNHHHRNHQIIPTAITKSPLSQSHKQHRNHQITITAITTSS